MGWLRDFFVIPSQDEVWKEFAGEAGGSYKPDGPYGKGELTLQYEEWLVTLDVCPDIAPGLHKTRLSSLYINRKKFYFSIITGGCGRPQTSIFVEQDYMPEFYMTKGMRTLKPGDAGLDPRFIIRTNDEKVVLELLSNSRLKTLIVAQPEICLQNMEEGGLDGSQYPEGLDRLYLEYPALVLDKDKLKELVDLFCLALKTLAQFDAETRAT